MKLNSLATYIHQHNWLDRAAITMAIICGVHCLITPVILIALPVIASTFWVDEHFHLWMLLLVLPTTTLAIFMGCRKHKDRWVMASAVMGLGLLITALVTETQGKGTSTACAACSACSATITQAHSSHTSPTNGTIEQEVPAHKPESGGLPLYSLINTLGGLFLIAGHARNFWLCRKKACSPREDCC